MYHISEKQLSDITNYIFLEDAPAPADVIFIPGCDRPEHAEEAARLYREGFAPLLIPSGRFAKAVGHFEGVARGAERYGTDFACEADFLAEVLRQNGAPDAAILPEREATYTLENAEKTRELLLRTHGSLPKRAILCCKAHHARRSCFYYSMVFPETEILVLSHRRRRHHPGTMAPHAGRTANRPGRTVPDGRADSHDGGKDWIRGRNGQAAVRAEK